jgi:hypothetical protein
MNDSSLLNWMNGPDLKLTEAGNSSEIDSSAGVAAWMIELPRVMHKKRSR